MLKTTLKLIGDLNELYDSMWHEWQKTIPDSPEFLECTQKMKLIRKITKQTEEQARGFLKSKIDYRKWGKFILENENLSYSGLHKGITDLLLEKTN